MAPGRNAAAGDGPGSAIWARSWILCGFWMAQAVFTIVALPVGVEQRRLRNPSACPYSAAAASFARGTDISSIPFHFRPTASPPESVLVEALGGGGQAQLHVAGHGLLQGALRRAALPCMEVAVGDLLLRVIAAGVP